MKAQQLSDFCACACMKAFLDIFRMRKYNKKQDYHMIR